MFKVKYKRPSSDAESDTLMRIHKKIWNSGIAWRK